MGYRFTLESANVVANLTFGRIMSCYREIYSSKESCDSFMYFLDEFNRNMYSNEKERYMRTIRDIKMALHNSFDGIPGRCRSYENIEYDETFLSFHRQALKALGDLSAIFERCAVKSLLLPRKGGYQNYRGFNSYDFMTSRDTLKKLVRLHEGDSCLILQPEEAPKQAVIFDAFPNFEVALRQADLWPAVLFWDGEEDFAFVPVKHENELLYLYEIICYERHPIYELRRVAERNRKASHYIFQLSDLHFGAKNVDVAERRLRTLLKSHLSTFEVDDTSQFVITGDAVESPKNSTENDYRNFSEYLEERCGEPPIRVLGNHDINNHGIALFPGRQHIANIVGDYPKIERLDEQKAILLLFNSNTNGNFAKGEIGTAQMSEMGNLLDNAENIGDYLLIAVLHHHLLPIPQPDFYGRKWLDKILSDELMDKTLELIDADLFMEWLTQRNVKFVLHGHKHIPFKTEHNGIHVIACGSSTGRVSHKEKGKTYMSYNLMKISENAVTVTLFAEELPGGGARNIYLPETVYLRDEASVHKS